MNKYEQISFDDSSNDEQLLVKFIPAEHILKLFTNNDNDQLINYYMTSKTNCKLTDAQEGNGNCNELFFDCWSMLESNDLINQSPWDIYPANKHEHARHPFAIISSVGKIREILTFVLETLMSIRADNGTHLFLDGKHGKVHYAKWNTTQDGNYYKDKFSNQNEYRFSISHNSGNITPDRNAVFKLDITNLFSGNFLLEFKDFKFIYGNHFIDKVYYNKNLYGIYYLDKMKKLFGCLSYDEHLDNILNIVKNNGLWGKSFNTLINNLDFIKTHYGVELIEHSHITNTLGEKTRIQITSATLLNY